MAVYASTLSSTSTRPKLALYLLLATWLATFWSSLQPMLNTYWSSGFDYQGLAIIPLFLLLVRQKSAALNRASATYNPYGLLFLLLSSLLWIIAVVKQITMLEQIALISMLPAIVLTTCGQKVTKIIALPLLCLFFLIPIGYPLFIQLQQAFFWLLLKVLAFSSMDVYWQSQSIFVGDQEYSMPIVLSALQFATLYLSFGAAYALIMVNSLSKRIVLLSSFILLPFAMLFLTVYGVIYMRLWTHIPPISVYYFSLLSWFAVIIGLSCALLLGFVLHNDKQSIQSQDNIDWRGGYSQARSTILMPTILTAGILGLLPFIAQHINEHRHISNYLKSISLGF